MNKESQRSHGRGLLGPPLLPPQTNSYMSQSLSQQQLQNKQFQQLKRQQLMKQQSDILPHHVIVVRRGKRVQAAAGAKARVPNRRRTAAREERGEVLLPMQCGPCFPCKRVIVSFKCSISESCPIVYRCMCKGKYYHVPSN